MFRPITRAATFTLTYPEPAMNILAAFLFLIPSLLTGGESVSEAVKLIEAKDYDGARKKLESIISSDASSAEARYHLGRLLANHYRQYDDAEEQLAKAVELAASNAEFHFALGNVYGIQAQNASIFSKLSYAGKVKDEFLRAVELSPDNVRYRLALLSYYLMAPGIAGGSVSKAREQGTELLKRDPYEGHIALAQIADYDKESELAEREFKSAIQEKPGHWRAHHLLGYFYLKLKRADDAIAQFIQYVKCAPNDPNSYDSLADGYTAKGETDQALTQYLKALDVDAAFPSSLYGAATIYDGRSNKTEALRYYRKYLETTQKGDNAEKAKDRVKELSGN